MNVRTGVAASAALQSAQHTLFVEGSTASAIDPLVLRRLLAQQGLTQVQVKELGSCTHIRSAAQALVNHHPSYYFLIDRDEEEQQVVLDAWANFPNPATHNLLIWPERELENYFINPTYLAHSIYLNVAEERLRERILNLARQRVFCDVANLVILQIRRQTHKTYAKLFTDPAKFQSADIALNALVNLTAFKEKKSEVQKAFRESSIKKLFKETLSRVMGDEPTVSFGYGDWLITLSGKEIFNSIASTCFRVLDANGKLVQGKDQRNEIAKELVGKDIALQPADFQQLVQLLRQRVASS